jgi:predicted DNA-binding transcriptional regulator AlpA
MDQVCALLQIGRMTLANWIKAGKFPRGFKIGPRRWYWPADVIDGLLGGRPPARRR